MTRLFTEEWLAQRELRQAQRIGKPTPAEKAQMADTWNGKALANCEVVDSLSGSKKRRQLGCPDTAAAVPCAGGNAKSDASVAPGPLTLILPWPPSGNSAVRHANGAHYLRPEVTDYRNRVAYLARQHERIRGPYTLEAEMSPPDALRRDIDNALKTMLDALVKCGWLEDDSMAYMKELHVYVRDDRRGQVSLRAIETTKRAA